MRKYLCRDERGIAMIAVIMTLLILSLLSTAVLSMATSNAKNSLVEREYQSAYYIAEAGMTILMDKVKTDMDIIWNATSNDTDYFNGLESIYSSEQDLHTMFESQYGHQPNAKVKLIKVAESIPDKTRTYMLVSRGITESVTRTVVKYITIQWFPKIDLGDLMSVFALGNMTIKQGRVEGPIGTNGILTVPRDEGAWPQIDDYYVDVTKIPNSIYHTSGINGVDSADPGNTYWIDTLCGTKHDLTEEKEYPLPIFPIFPDQALATTKPNQIYTTESSSNICELTDSLTYISRISVTANGSMTIKYNGDCSLLIDDFYIPNGNVYLNGTGTLTLYVRNETSFANTQINPPVSGMTEIEAANRLTIYLKGRINNTAPIKTLTVDDNTKLYGSFYAEDANVIIDGSGKHIGNIVTGGTSVETEGSTSTTNQLIYAPLANVKMSGSNTVYGPIVAKEFILDGSGKVMPGPGDLLPNPYFPEEGSDLISIEGVVREQ